MSILYHLKQPKGLYVLGFAEAWDRLTFYGLQAVLVLTITQKLHFSDQSTYSLFGIFTVLAFGVPLIGGLVADKLLGRYLAVMSGGLLMIIGCLVLSINIHEYLHIGLGITVIGVGLFKSSLTSQVSTLYDKQSDQRETGSALFYTIMNIGGFAGPLLYGFTTAHYGAQTSLLVSVIGIALSLLLYHFTKTGVAAKGPYRFFPHYISAVVLIVVLIVLATVLFTYILLFNLAIWVFCAGTVSLIIIFSLHLAPDLRRKFYAYLTLNAFAILFYAGYMQSTSSMLLFIKRDLPHTLFHHTIPTASFASLEPLFIILLAPFIAPLWAWMTRRYQNHAIILRCGLGLVLGTAFLLVLAFAADLSSSHHNSNWPLTLVVISNALLAIGELSIGPALIAAIAYLAPQRYESTYIGIWSLATSFSGYVGTLFAYLSDQQTDTLNSAHIYAHSYYLIAGILAASILLLIIASRWIKSAVNAQQLTA